MRSKRHEFETYVAEGAWLVVTHLLHRESRQETVVNPYLTNCTRETRAWNTKGSNNKGGHSPERERNRQNAQSDFSRQPGHIMCVQTSAEDLVKPARTTDRVQRERGRVPAVAEIPVATDAVVAPPEHAFSTGMREAQCGQVGSDFRLDLFPMGSNPAFPVGGEVVDEGEGDSQLERAFGKVGNLAVGF